MLSVQLQAESGGVTPHVGRHETKKARTRDAIISTCFRLYAADGLDHLTAQRVADEAGVSRRTFFNYFPSVEAALAARDRETFAAIRAQLAARPPHESLIDSACAVVSATFSRDFLAEMATVWHVLRTSPRAQRYALASFEEEFTAFAEEWGRERLGARGDDPLFVGVVTAAILSAFDVARQQWGATHSGAVSEADRAAFIDATHRALEIIRPLVPAPPSAEGSLPERASATTDSPSSEG